MSRTAATTAASPGSPSTTPPASDLCRRPERLHRDRIAELPRGGDGLVDRAGPAGRRKRDPRGGEQLARLEVAGVGDGRSLGLGGADTPKRGRSSTSTSSASAPTAASTSR